jgi:HlyD family secretion protein
MNSAIAFLKTKAGIALVLAIVLGGGYYFTVGNNAPKEQTLVVHPADFTQQVSVSGKVIPAQEVDLGFTQSGRVARVYVKVGDTVAAGRVLAEIDSGDIRANLLQKQAALDMQKAKLASLQQGTRPEEIAVAEGTVASAESALVQSNEALANSIKDAYIKSDDAVRNDVYQFVSNPRSDPQISFTSTDSQSLIDTRAKVLATETELVAWNAEIQNLSASSDLSLAVSRAFAHLAVVNALLTSASKSLNSAFSGTVSQTTIDGYSADVATARASISTVSAAITTAVTAQKSAAASLDAARKNLALKKAGTVQADIDAQAAQVSSAEAEVASVRSQLDKTVIIAPFTGVITTMDAKAGMIVSPNTPEISMISASTFQIESYVPEVNIALVKVRDRAKVTLDAYGDEVTFDASVVSIDPAGTIRDGVPTYRALLQFSGSDARIRSGMTANITIITAQKTGVISVPQGLVVSKGGKKYVSVKEGETTTEREVTTGAVSSLGDIEILTGLSDGDVLLVSSGK